jgi:uncharacterized protein YdeI (YjbR/CyaY-like superfamily)
MSLARRRGLKGMTYGAMIELAERPRVLDVPPRIADVLDEDDRARQAFSRLSYEQQRWLVLTVGTSGEARLLPAVP